MKRKLFFRTKSGEPIDPEQVENITLYQIIKPDKFVITQFKLKFIQDEELETLIKNLYKIESSKIPDDPKDKYQYLTKFFLSTMGNTDILVLEDWLKQKGF